MNTELLPNQKALLAFDSEEPEAMQAVYQRVVHGCRDAVVLKFTTR